MIRSVAWVVLTVAVLGAAAGAVQAAPGAKPVPQRKKPDGPPAPAAMSLDKLGAEYRRLRALDADPKQRKRHYDDLRAWGYRMQQVMEELGRRLGAAGTPAPKLVEVMGKPDEIQLTSEFWGFVRVPDETLYMYWWRQHDLLYFEVRGGAILGSSWWYPLE